MNVFRGSLLAVLFLCVCTAVKAEETKRIAVVNVSLVFKAFQKVKDVQSKMEKLFEPDKKAIEADGQKLKAWEDKMRVDGRDPKVDIDFFRQIQQFELAKMELEKKFRDLREKVESQRKDEMKGVLKDIKNAIRDVGTREKFDLVLRAPEFDEDIVVGGEKTAAEKEEEPRSATELVRRFRENPVLYFAQGVDVTSKVIAKLNDDYRGGTGVK